MTHFAVGSFVQHSDAPEMEGIVVGVVGECLEVLKVYDDDGVRSYAASPTALAPWEGDIIAHDRRAALWIAEAA